MSMIYFASSSARGSFSGVILNRLSASRSEKKEKLSVIYHPENKDDEK